MLRSTALLCVLLLVAVCRGGAQQYSVRVETGGELRGKAELCLYGDVHTVCTRSGNKGGVYEFSGRVDKPVYAEFYHRALSEPIGFFVENGDIRIRLNGSVPSLSPINGSRSNSLFRYTVEQWDYTPDSIINYVCQHPAAPEGAYLLSLLPSDAVEADSMLALMAQMQEPATKTKTYALLQQKIQTSVKTNVGMPMPDFLFTNEKGQQCHFDSVCAMGEYTILMVGATWCEQCVVAEQQLRSTEPDIALVTVSIDNDKKGWDADYMKQLSVSHIPYIFVVNPKGIIVGNDIRWWETARTIAQDKANYR